LFGFFEEQDLETAEQILRSATLDHGAEAVISALVSSKRLAQSHAADLRRLMKTALKTR